MQRLCSKLRTLAVQSTHQNLGSLSSCGCLLHSKPLGITATSITKWNITNPLFNPSSSSTFRFPSVMTFPSSPFLLCLVQVRHASSREQRKKKKPRTPVTSKVKKVKMKFYSSYKSRFRALSDRTIRRWREGKNHNAHLKSKKARRRLRQPSIVPAAYAKVMKKLGFFG